MKILVIRFSSLGDVLLTTPIVRSIRKNYPSAEIHFLTKKEFAPILENNPNINQIIKYDNKNDRFIDIIKLIANNQYDLIIDLQSKLNSFLIKLFAGNSKHVTYNKRHFYRWRLTHKSLSKNLAPIKSTVSLYSTVLDKLGIKLDAEKLDIFLPKNQDEIYSTFRIPHSEFRISISPGASHFTKQYPADYYSYLINMITDKLNAQIILLGSKNEKKLTAQIANGCKKKILDLAGETDIMDMAVIIKNSELFISGDCGPMHIAAALNIPQIAIFGPTHPKLGFAPINTNAVIIQKDLSCRPCSLHGREKCPKTHFKCMKDIKPEEILTKIEMLSIPNPQLSPIKSGRRMNLCG